MTASNVTQIESSEGQGAPSGDEVNFGLWYRDSLLMLFFQAVAIWLRYSAVSASPPSSPTPSQPLNVSSNAGDVTPTPVAHAHPAHTEPDTPTGTAGQEEHRHPTSSLLFGPPPPLPGHCQSCTCTTTSIPRVSHMGMHEEALDHDILPWQMHFLHEVLDALLRNASDIQNDPGPNDFHKCSVVRG
jgi:hypothetical protein